MKHLIIHVTFWMFHVKIKEIIVVEGKSDYTLLKSFLDVEIIITNGSEISKETLDLIKKANETKGVIILTDPDYPGMQIRNKINQYTSGCKNAFVEKSKAIKGKKVGTVTITATTANGKKATCKVTVVEVTLNASTIPVQVGKT